MVSFHGTSSKFDVGDNIQVTGADAQNPLHNKTVHQIATMQIPRVVNHQMLFRMDFPCVL